MRNLYLTQAGNLNREQNTLVFSNEYTTKRTPVQEIDCIFALSEISINSKLLNYLTQFQIPIFFYNYFGYYSGVYSPRQEAISGKILVEQVKHYDDTEKRLEIAKAFVSGALHNMRKTLMQYNLPVENFDKYKEKVHNAKNVQGLLLDEAEIRIYYFRQFNSIINNKEFEFIKRVRQPPDNFINTLISFGNSLLYNTVLSEIFKTQLNPTIAYLHEPFERRYSLNLDMAEIFKPLIADRVIFSLINKKIIKPEHFDKELNYCYLNKEGRRLFLREFDNKLQQTLKHPELNRKVSYRYMLRLECYKLVKHLMEGHTYKPFKIYW
ncbi:MAG: type I-B CRISPR-associated endonuclease Cas1b [Candidatus Woesearchaeota archaeon]